MHFGWQRCIQILWRKWSEAGRNTLRWKKVGNLVRIFGGTHGEQQQDWQCWSTQHIDFHVRRAPGMVGSDKKKFFHLHNLLELTGQKKFSNCPNFLKHENIFRMPQKFGHKWKLSSTFIRCRLLLSKMRIPKMPNKFQASKFFRVPLLQLFLPTPPYHQERLAAVGVIGTDEGTDDDGWRRMLLTSKFSFFVILLWCLSFIHIIFI